MATFTLLEWQTVTPTGEPVGPASSRQTGLAFAVAKQLAAGTAYFMAIPDVDARFRMTDTGAAATSADLKIYADVGWAQPNALGARPYVYLTAA